MKAIRVTAIATALLALVPAAQGQIGTLPIHHGGSLTRAATLAIENLVTAGREAPLRFESRGFSAPEFCRELRGETQALHIAILSLYRACMQDVVALRALDFPFLARDWTAARRLLNGPLGSAVVEGFAKRNLELFGFWDGDARVFGSRTVIARSQDMQGRQVVGPPTFASNTAILQSGARPVVIPFAEVYNALQAGSVDTADTSMTAFDQLRLQEVQRNILISNHSLDPYVLAVPSKVLSQLSVAQRAFLDHAIRGATAFQIVENARQQATATARWREAGLNVASLSPELRGAFRTEALLTASVRQARDVFSDSSEATAKDATGQVAGQPLAPFWKVHFVTNRERKGDAFTNDLGSGLLYGTADFRMEWDDAFTSRAELQREERRGRVSYRATQQRMVIDWNAVSATPFPDGLTRGPHAAPAKAPLIYIHGFANSFQQAAERTAWLGWNARRPAILFAWASQGSAFPVSNYEADRTTAARTWGPLAGLLERFGQQYDTETDVDIVVHSMGAYVLLGALEEMRKRSGSGKPPKFRQVVLVAADVPSAQLASTWDALSRFFFSKATLYVSDHDQALGISKQHMNPSEGNRAGLAPPILNKAGIESIFIGPNEFSFTGHSYHITNGIIGDDILELVRYGTLAGERRGSGPAPAPNQHFILRRLRIP